MTKRIISMILALVMVAGLLPQLPIHTHAQTADTTVNGLKGKTISILGASISTYTGISNNTAYNSTIGDNAIYYTEGRYGIYAEDTYWMQTIQDLGLELCVNNAWSGSSALHTRNGTTGAYVDRCVQLHNNEGEEPDIIAIQMGTNDFQYYKDTLGTADIDYDALITDDGNGTYTYATPVTTLEAIAIILHKISVRYPAAEVYYLGLSNRVDFVNDEHELLLQFNEDLQTVCTRFDAAYVDIYNCGITQENFNTYIGDGRVHPNALGMDCYTEALKAAILANSAYRVDTHTVTMNLDDVTADYGTDKILANGDSFTVNLTGPDTLQVTVTMGGQDITASAYANGTVTIDSVTDDVTVTAKSVRTLHNYRWEFDGTDLASTDGGNPLTKTAGTTTDGVFNKTAYSLTSAVVLRHDEPWVVEWKSEGTFMNTGGSTGARIFTSDNVNANYNARYIFKSNTNGIIAMGEKDTAGSHNYGIALADYGIDWTALHTYRLENRIADDGSNMIYLFVDGKEIGPMNHYYIGTKDQKATSNWLSGKDFVFPYMGTDTHGFTNCAIDYIQIWEGGETSKSLSLRYDDHYDVTGKTVEIVDAGKPTSYKVGYGVAQGTLDDAVITLNGNTLIATGIGTAKVRIDGALYEVTVTAAPISLILLAGQSNMQGSEGDANQSIVCPDGMVYATYGDRYTMTVDNATNFAPSALTGSCSALNVNGTTTNLKDWPVYLLTEAGAGKAGPDSGFAYEWVKQTGEKVWIVNAAHGGSSITTWQDGGANYEEALLLFSACQQTLRQEIAAGHYTLSHMGYFWCQGCTDYSQTAEWYVNKYLTMHENFKTELAFDHDSNPATVDKVFEFAGIIPVRAGHDYYTSYRQGEYADTTTQKYHESFLDLRFTGPRVAQYWMTNNPDLPDIWNVCNIGESWVWMPDGTNGVSDYFLSHYENGTVDYQTQVAQKASWYTPTTPAAVHDSIHYNQIGYNEVGRESVRNALILLGEIEAPEVETTVKFLTWDGYTEADQITASTTGSSGTLVVPMVYPVWKSKEVTYNLSEGLIWNYYDLLAADPQTSGTLTAVGADGKSVTVGKADPYFHFIDHLSQLPKNVCCGLNLWNALTHDKYYYSNGTGWGTHSSGSVYSVTIPVNPGDLVYASSFGKAGTNGHSSTSGIRVTFFSDYAVAKTMTPAEVYSEFTANGGYLVVPEGAVAVNIAMWNNSDDNAIYILNRPHDTTGDICSICGSDSHTHSFTDWETVTAPSIDGPGIEQRTCTGCGETETREVEGVWQTLKLSDHMAPMPDAYCAGTNLWPLLEHDKYFFNGSTSWTVHSSGTVYSVTIPVNPGDKIFATSFGASGKNGGSKSGIRVTFFDAHGVLKTLAPADTYAEFTANGGYLIAPEGAVAVNIPMWTNSADNELYILTLGHSYSGTSCVRCDAVHPEAGDYAGKVISILSASTSTFAGYIPTADGFNLEHRPRYPQDNLLTDVNETWWMQVINELDAKLGINDSWAGSQVLNTQDSNSGDLGPDACMASLTRIQNLGANGTPDLILFFGASNDMGRGVTLGRFDPATAPTEVDLTATKWDTLADAYVAAIMRLQYFYPDAEIVVMTTYAMPSYVTNAKLDKYGPVLKAICDHYGVKTVDLRNSGVTFDMLPDNIHPNAEGMDHITEYVLQSLLKDVNMEAGEHTVHSVTHNLTNASASLQYYKGVSAGKPFVETVSGENVTVTVTMGGVDITASVYADGVIAIPAVTGELVITLKGQFDADGHLQQLPESFCAGTNLWTALEPENIYYTATGWGNNANSNYSVTVPVTAGDRIWATSFGKAGENGYTANGVRLTWFSANGVLLSMTREAVYEEFSTYGYLTAPEGAVAVNVVMKENVDSNEFYILSAPHNYNPVVTAPTCTDRGYTTYTCSCGDRYVSDYVDPTGVHNVDTDRLYNTITIHPGQLDSNTDDTVLDSDIYGYVVNYPLKKGHVLSISDTNYVFSVRKWENGAYSTMLKQATTASFTATEDMTVAMLIRKPDKSPVTAEELANIVIYDSQFGMIGVEGTVIRFTVEAETIDGGTATTRAAIFLPESYSDSGEPTRLIVMTNGHSAHLTDSVWNKNSAENVQVIKNYLNNNYAVWVVDNTAASTSQTPDLGCPQLVDSYFKAYQYIQNNLNVEQRFSIHARSFGTFAAVRIMREHPELVKCAVMTGSRVSIKAEWPGIKKTHVAKRFGFADTTGATYETDKLVGYDPYTDVNDATYALPPTFWMLAEGDSTAKPCEFIEKLTAHGGDVTLKIYSDISHTGICTLNTDETFADALAYLERYQNLVHTHSYSAHVTEPTCTTGGYTTHTCVSCGASYTGDHTDALGHSYSGAVCTICGEAHPNAANYEGKVISILGDSISTFAGYIPTADGFNREHLARYPQDNLLTDVNETWWMQTITALDGKLGINDSWRGSTVSGYPSVTTGVAGYLAAMSNLTQIQNLGSNGTPDVILFYGGTNDLAHTPSLGTFDPATAPTEVDLTTLKWDNLADAYAQILLRLKHFYPDTQIICLLPTYTTSYYSNDKLAKGNALMASICEHYGVTYIDLRYCGISTADLPDGIHPDATGMDYITNAVLDTLLSQDVEHGENVVHSVTHELTGVESSLGYYKGVSAGKPFVTTITGDNLTVTVTMGGVDVTALVYADGVVNIPSVTGDLVITATGKQRPIYADYLQQLPENICPGTNLWTVLEHDAQYYTVNGWGVHSSGKVYSVTIPIVPGDQIWATSFQASGANGGTINGIRLTWFGQTDVLRSMDADSVYTEFSTNGYLTAPEGAVAVNVVMWTGDNSNELYILNAEHNFTATVTAPTCTEDGCIIYTCAVCRHTYSVPGENASGHSWGDWYEVAAPSCNAPGSKQRDCQNCDAVDVGVIAAAGHDYAAVITEPTCAEQGYTTYTCKNCGHTYVDDYVQSHGHSWGQWYEASPATCAAAGEMRRDCANCSAFESYSTGFTDHSYHCEVTAPTCEEQGYTTYTCTVCGHSYVDGYTEPAGHSWGQWYVVEEGDCTNPTFLQRQCRNCPVIETDVIPAPGHSYDSEVTAPTCTAEGYTTHTCTVCGDSYRDTFTNALGHDWSQWYTMTEPTCALAGKEGRDCSRCSGHEERGTDPMGHDYAQRIVEPTCTSQGHTVYTCKVCGHTYQTDIVEPLGHIWDSGVITKEPTEDAGGVKTYTCSRCGETYTESIPPLDHTHVYGAVVTEPTCETGGFTTHICACGDRFVDSHTAALGHDWSQWYTQEAATCTTDGTNRRDCSRCSRHEICTIAATGHEFVPHEGKAPGCETVGWEDYEVCEKCGESSYQEIPATGHSYTSTVVSPGCETEGYTEYTCAGCGSSYRDSVVLATGHSYESVVTAPTCDSPGYTTHTCAACGASYADSYTDPLGHSGSGGICDGCGQPYYALGDVNGDGRINNIDAMLILQYAVGVIDETRLLLSLADVNGDGKINNIDAMLVLQRAVGVITKFPIE